jgi:xanthine dehydrogenase accessory factor
MIGPMNKRRDQDADGASRSAAPALAIVPQPAPEPPAPTAPALSSEHCDGSGALAQLPAPSPGTAALVLAAGAAGITRGVCGAMATVLERHGSAPGTPGQKLYLSADGICVGTVGGGAVERAVIEALVVVAKNGANARHDIRTFKLGPELGMCCGGRLVVLLEPLAGLVPSLIVGGGHVATAVAPLLAKVGFGVTVVDARERWGEEGRIEGVTCVAGEFDEVGRQVDPAGVCLVMTHDHALDQRAIEWGLRRGFAYVGGVGSRAKAERTRQRLEAKGFSEADRARVRMPIGADIGARTPEEIAVAIAAEMIAWRKSR